VARFIAVAADRPLNEWQKVKKMSSTNLTPVQKKKYDRDQVRSVVRKKYRTRPD